MQTRTAALRRVSLAIALIAIVVAACDSQSPPTPPTAPSPTRSTAESTLSLPSASVPQAEPSAPSAADVQAAAQIIAAANADDANSLDAVGGKLLFTQAGAQAAQEALDNGVSGDALWAALWVYGTAGTDPAAVTPYLTNSDPSLRAMAAVDDIELGDASGFAVLLPLLSTTDSMRASEPPRSVAAFVAGALDTVVDPQIAPSTDDGPSTWASWLSSNASNLRFDDNNGVWTTK